MVEVNNEDDSCYPDDHVIQLQFFVGLPYAERTMSVTQNQTSSSLSPLSTYFEELFCYYTVVDRVVKYMYLPTVGYDHSDVG